jgi:hypothetical protein
VFLRLRRRGVAPISPVGWQLTFDGESVLLAPSIGSWTLKCKSRYWVRRNRVIWAGPMSAEKIAEVQRRDSADVLCHHGAHGPTTPPKPMEQPGRATVPRA